MTPSVKRMIEVAEKVAGILELGNHPHPRRVSELSEAIQAVEAEEQSPAASDEVKLRLEEILDVAQSDMGLRVPVIIDLARKALAALSPKEEEGDVGIDLYEPLCDLTNAALAGIKPLPSQVTKAFDALKAYESREEK